MIDAPWYSMSLVSDVELAYRLLVTGGTIVGPTILFLGLWRFLGWLRDDELVKLLADRGVVERPKLTPADVMDTMPGDDGATTRCDTCGATNTTGAPVCRDCSSNGVS